MPTKRKRDESPSSNMITAYGEGSLWHRTSHVIRPGTYPPTHIIILKKPKFRQTHSLPVTMAVKSAVSPYDVALLKKERKLFETVKDCTFFIKCFGEEICYNEKGLKIHNLVLEHSYVNLGLLIRERGMLSEMGIRRITRQMLEGVCVLHKLGYVHCGLNPEILLVFGSDLKIGDLGFVKKASEEMGSGYVKRDLRYLAPEVVGEGILGGSADVWAIGCMLIEMLTGQSMWAGKKDKEIEESLLKICKGSGLVRIPCTVPEKAYGFLMGCLDRKASRRSTAEMLLKHPFVAFADEEY